jgi:hypothetical protein
MFPEVADTVTSAVADNIHYAADNITSVVASAYSVFRQKTFEMQVNMKLFVVTAIQRGQTKTHLEILWLVIEDFDNRCHYSSISTARYVLTFFVRNNVLACFIKHLYHNMFRLKSKPSSGVIVYRILNVSYL